MKNEFPSNGYHRFKVDISLVNNYEIGSSSEDELIPLPFLKKRRVNRKQFLKIWDNKSNKYIESNILKKKKEDIFLIFM